MRSVLFVLTCLALTVFDVAAEEPIDSRRPFFDALSDSIAENVHLLGPALQQLELESANGNAVSQFLLGRYLVDQSPNPRAHQQGITLLEFSAGTGLAEANFRLGEIYRGGIDGVRRQPSRAIPYYEAAMEAGHVSAKRELATLLLDSSYEFADRGRGIALLRELAEIGDEKALISLGWEDARDPTLVNGGKLAIESFNRAAVGGSSEALHALGDLFRDGTTDIPADAETALGYYEILGQSGSLWALRKAADIYLKGETGNQDVSRAVALLKDAGVRGDAWGWMAIGDLFSSGDLVPIDVAAAVEAYDAAAKSGLVNGYVALGDLYRSGAIGFPADATKAKSLYDLAVAARVQGYPWALVRLGDLYRFGADGIEPDGVAAMGYYEQAARLNDNGARRSLGSLLLEGWLVPPSPQRALIYLTEAAEQGDAEAALLLGGVFSAGGTVSPSYDGAVRYFRMAADLGDSSAPLRLAVALADGPLAAMHRQEGISYLASAVASGESGAVAELARLIIDGKVPGTPPTEARDMLKNAALNGDADAAKYILQLYRDGMPGRFRSDLRQANELLKALRKTLGTQQAATESIAILAKQGSGPTVLSSIATEFNSLPRWAAKQTLERLATTNQNAYIALAQGKLVELGLYSGVIDGVLTGLTIDAFRAACEAAGALEKCDRGPLTSDAVRLISAYLFTARPSSNPIATQ